MKEKSETVSVQVAPLTKERILPFDSPNSAFNPERAEKHFLKLGRILVLRTRPPTRPFYSPDDVGITDSWQTASICFAASQYAPAILFASVAVEVVFNRDLRMDGERRDRRGWLALNRKTLRIAASKGLPVEALLNEGESLESGVVEFIVRRNKVAHGDIAGYSRFYSVRESERIDLRPTEEDALDQLTKSINFIEKWANQGPRIRQRE